jgi:hypothetical protein
VISVDSTAGSWIGLLDLGTDATGRRQRTKVRGSTRRAEARDKLDALRAQRDAGLDITARTATFAELADAWLERGLPADLSGNATWNYRRIVRVHVLPTRGPSAWQTRRSDDIDAMLDVMSDRGTAASSTRHARNLSRRVLWFGMRRDLVIRIVAEPVQTRRCPKAERYGFTAKHANKLLRVAADDRLAGLITVSLLLGLRPGDAAGLQLVRCGATIQTQEPLCGRGDPADGWRLRAQMRPRAVKLVWIPSWSGSPVTAWAAALSRGCALPMAMPRWTNSIISRSLRPSP